MVRGAWVPPELTQGPFLGSEAVRRGLLSRAQLRGPQWRRLSRDVYVFAGLADSPTLRIRAAGLLVPAGAVLSGASAAWVHGADVLRGPQVEVTVPPLARNRPRDGLTIRRAQLAQDDVTVIRGHPVTTPLRTAFDLARRPAPRGDLTEHVVAADSLAYRARFTPEQLAAFAARPRFTGLRGVRQVAKVAAHCEPRTESPGETRVRMRMVYAGLPRPAAQVEVYDAWGRFIARLDLAYEEMKLGVEYDGAWHADRWAHDAARANQLREAGWELFTYTATDLRPGVETIPRQIGAALARRGAAPRRDAQT